MHWIWVGFLIAIGFALAGVVLPLLFGLLGLAWEFKWIALAGIGISIMIVLGFIYPQGLVPAIIVFIVLFLVIGTYIKEH